MTYNSVFVTNCTKVCRVCKKARRIGIEGIIFKILSKINKYIYKKQISFYNIL